MFTGKFLKGWAVGAGVVVSMVAGAAHGLTLGQATLADFSVNQDVTTFDIPNAFGTSYMENLNGATFSEASIPQQFLNIGPDFLGTFTNAGDTTRIIVEFDSPVNRIGFDWVWNSNNLPDMNIIIDVFENQNGGGMTNQITFNSVLSFDPNGNDPPAFVGLKSTDSMTFQRIEIQLEDTEGSQFMDDFRFEAVATGPAADPVIPEPTTAVLGLVGLGALGLLVVRPRKHTA